MVELGFRTKADVMEHLSDIKLKIKKDITNDFVLAKLGEQDKTGITGSLKKCKTEVMEN